MARRSDTGKHAEWRERLERFSRSGLTVARFCGGEGVSVASFYHWRKKLGQAAPRRRGPAGRGAFRQVAVVRAPAAVVPAGPAGAPAGPALVPAASRVSIQLPCGTRIEVDAKQLDALRAVVGEVARAHRSLETAIPSC